MRPLRPRDFPRIREPCCPDVCQGPGVVARGDAAVRVPPPPVTGAKPRGPRRYDTVQMAAIAPPLSAGRELHDLDIDIDIDADGALELDSLPSSHRTRVETPRPSMLHGAPPARPLVIDDGGGRSACRGRGVLRLRRSSGERVRHAGARSSSDRAAAHVATRPEARASSALPRRRPLRGIAPHRGRRRRAERPRRDRRVLHNDDIAGLDGAAGVVRHARLSVLTGPRPKVRVGEGPGFPFVLHFSI